MEGRLCLAQPSPGGDCGAGILGAGNIAGSHPRASGKGFLEVHPDPQSGGETRAL